MAGSWRGKERNHVQASGYVAHSLEASLWSVGRTGDFEEAVLLAATWGGGCVQPQRFALTRIPTHSTSTG
jgi:hypothetical protein